MIRRTRKRLTSRVVTFLNSNVGVAVVSVVLGGLFSTVIASVLQNIGKERELKNTWLHDRAQHRIAAQRLFLDEQRATAEQCFRLIGRVRRSARVLIDILSDEFKDDNFRGAALRAVQEQKTAIRTEFNAAGEEWQKTGNLFAYLLSDYPSNAQDVSKIWPETERAVDALRLCAETRYRTWARDGNPPSTRCETEELDLISATRRLSSALQKSRVNARWDWENACTLATLLGEKSPDCSASEMSPRRMK